MPTTSTSKKVQQPLDSSLSKDGRFLDKLIELLHTPVKKYRQNKEAVPISPQKSSSAKINHPTFEREAKLLKYFGTRYKEERVFSQSHYVDKFILIFQELIKSRLCNRVWVENASPENYLRLFHCLRLLLRDPNFQNELHAYDGIRVIAENLKLFGDQYIVHGGDETLIDILKEIINICQKMSIEEHQRSIIVANEIHKTLVLLLSSTSLVIIHLSTFALIALTKSDEAKIAVSELNVVERLLQIIGEFDSTSKQVASTLLRQLCTVQEIKQQIRIYHGVPTLLSLLRSDAMKLLWNILCILVHLAEDTETSNMVRLLGGIPILVSLLQNRQYSYDDEVFDGSSSVRFKNNDVTNLKSAVCAALTQLILNDTNARHLLQANGIYFVALQIFTKKSKDERNHLKSNELQLQKNAFRTLRFMFSMERNRQLFKRIFPPDLFEIFIDVGHYQQELDAYDKLVQIFNQLPDEEIDTIKENVQAVNQNKEPIYHIQQYAVYEHLGSGAFGSVYKVKKKGGQTFLAMKEISTHNTEFGKSARERNTNANGIINECIFVKKQINHVNIVKYHKAFVEGDKLYIIMDLIDGAPLGEHFNALKEKQQMFSEDRLWNIFIQIVLALRYIHKEKSIVHRDLTPNNIMLGEDYKVTITDFGLARQKNSDASKLTSMVGTIVYSCPEVVRGIEYGEKADIWAIGCILYQMACLEPPFFSSNMLSLATKIVEGEYEELPDGLYDPLVSTVIQRCLTVKAEERPDIIEVASLIPDLLISHMEKLRMQTFDLERRLEKEKKRLQRHTDDMKNYHMSYNSGSGKQKYDESFSEQESGATSDNQTDSSLPSSARSRQKSLPSNNIKYEESLTPSTDDDGGGCRQFKSKPIKIQQRSDQRREIVSSSGSFEEDTEEDDLFKKPSNLPRRLDPHQNNNNRRKFSQNDIHTEAVVDKMMNHVKRTQSCSYIDNLNALEKTPTKHRPTSAQTTLTISPRRVRVIDDPVLQMLTQLHKIIYITQLPPPMKIDATRRTIDQYKRSLFSAPSSALSLKNELKKLLEGSKEHVDIVSPSLEGSGRFNTSLSNLNEQAIDASVTYEELKTMLEISLVNSGYYAHHPSSPRVKPRLKLFSSKPTSQ